MQSRNNFSIWLKATVPRDFRLQVFFHKSVSAKPFGPFRIFSKKFAEITAAQGAPPVSLTDRGVLPPHQRRGVHTRRTVRGWWVNISEDDRHWIGLSQNNPSTHVAFLIFLLHVLPYILFKSELHPLNYNLDFST